MKYLVTLMSRTEHTGFSEFSYGIVQYIDKIYKRIQENNYYLLTEPTMVKKYL